MDLHPDGSHPSDQDFEQAFASDAENFLRTHAASELHYAGRARSALLAEFGLVGSSNWVSSRGITALEQLRAIRGRKPSGSVVLTDTTAMLTSAAITIAPDTRLATAFSLLDLSSILNSAAFHDHILYLGPLKTPWCGDLGGYLNELLDDDVFVMVTDPDVPAADTEGLAFSAIFYEAAASLKRIFIPDASYAPNVSALELNEVVATWSKLLRRPVGSLQPLELYDPDVSQHQWRSAMSGYGSWLIRRLGTQDNADMMTFDLDAFIRNVGPKVLGEIATEVHLRALFNSALAYNVLECPYRATVIRQPWSKLFASRPDAVAQSLLLEGLFEDIVRQRRTQFQLPSRAVLQLPSVLSLALRDARIPAGVWHITGQIRADLAPFRRRQAELIRVLTEGDDPDDQAYARALLQALQDGVPQTLADNADAAMRVTLSVLPRLVAAPTGAGMVDLLVTANAAARSSGILRRLVRRVFQPELQVMSELSIDAGAALGTMRHVGRLWEINDTAVKTIQVGLEKLST